MTDRPPNLETPLKYFQLDYTPNNVFFVRWHLAGLPDSVSLDTFRLRIKGNVNKELALSVNDLKTKFAPVTITAVCQCSGNSRSFFDPRVPGGQWKNGAMGNAKWTGVKLKDILTYAGVKKDSIRLASGQLSAWSDRFQVFVNRHSSSISIALMSVERINNLAILFFNNVQLIFRLTL